MEDELLEIKPNKITFKCQDLNSIITIQNLTLHFIQCRIVSPNPTLLNISHERVSIAPCSTLDVNIRLKLCSSSLVAIQSNRKLTIFYYDADELEESNWNLIPTNKLGRTDIQIDYEIESLKFKIFRDEPITKPIDHSIILQPLQMNSYVSLSEDTKRNLIEFYSNTFGDHQTYKVLDDRLIFISQNKIDIKNEIHIMEMQDSLLYLSIYKPSMMIIATQKKELIEPMSPQIQRKQKQQKQVEQQKQLEQLPKIEQVEVIQPVIKQIEINRPQQRSQSIQLKADQVKYSTPQRQSVQIKELSYEKQVKMEQKQPDAPVVFKEPNSQPQQSELKINVVAQLKSYQQLTNVLLFRDGKYMVTIGEKQDIKVWAMSIKGVVGQIKDHEGKKKILIFQEWRYIDQTADENYEFQTKDPQELKVDMYTKYETAYRFITGSDDQIFRIFNLQSMKMEYSFNCRLQIPTSLAFLPDRGLFCIGGQPFKTIFGMQRKYRSVRFFRMDTLQEKPKYKIYCENEDDYLSEIVYTENPREKDHYHARLNNTLMIHIHKVSSQGKQVQQSAKLYFVFLDRENKCTVLLTLECDQLNIKGVNHVRYLHKQGNFAIIEQIDTKGSQKLVIVNIKQLHTQKGMQNGIECNLIQESLAKMSMQVMANPLLIIIPREKNLQIQTMNGEQKELIEGSSIRTKLGCVGNFVYSVYDDIVEILSIQ
ncbi:hypothetical protein pb186bvf_001554 [Paramecium bursaria]